jgi:hypothetical protein
MSKFKFISGEPELVADESGDLSYDEAVNALVEDAVAGFEKVLWNMVDELEYVIMTESEAPTEDPNDEFFNDDEDATEDGQTGNI